MKSRRALAWLMVMGLTLSVVSCGDDDPTNPNPSEVSVTISPNTGPTTGGTVVTVTLQGATMPAAATVSFDGIPAAAVEITSSTTATVTTPAHPAGPSDVTVVADGNSYLAQAAFTFVNPEPTVSSVLPSTGPTAGGTNVTVFGSGFLAGASATFGGVAGTSVNVINGSQLTVMTPAGSAGAVAVAVTNSDGQSGSLAGGFTYQAPAPTVTSVSPNSGPAAGGTAVTITGTNFEGGAQVFFGNGEATGVTVVSGTSITATSPAGSGVVGVTVTNPGGASGGLNSAFSYDSGPTVTEVNPSVGPTTGGTEVTISGINFQTGATVTFGGVAAPTEERAAAVAAAVDVVSSTLIRATTPAGSSGGADVTVTNPDGQSSTLPAAFVYNPAPTISSVTPNIGPPGGGTPVQIQGTGFQAGATVTIGGATPPEVVVVSDQLINVITPTGLGASDVVVTNPDGQSVTLAGGFNFGGTPNVTSVTPNAGLTGGGTVVTISGSNFETGASVTFGGFAATSVTVNSTTTITATTPAGTLGAVDVTVNNPSGGSGTLVGGFTYVPPNITSVAPTSGPTAGGTVITITGTNFEAGATVTVGGVAATSVNVVNSTTITATTPPNAAGAANVQVSNPSGGGGLLPNGFTYVPPSVTGITPNTGPQAGGTAVTITGTDFETGATVTIGGTAATGVTVVNTTTITATTPFHAPGTVDVVVTNPSTTTATLTNGFTYVPPSVTSITPNSGFVSGGTSVTIGGTDFETGASVTVGGSAATGVTVVNATTITATTPSFGTAAGGQADVVVTNPSTTTATLTNGFTYDPLPVISSVSPNSGFTAGGTSVTIGGQFFQTGATVTVGGSAATGVTVVNSTTITLTTPTGAAGAADVVVTNPDTGSDTSTGGFTFVPPPSITSISPSVGGTVGGLAVTITGTDFTAGAGVTIGGSAATSVTVVNSTTITANTPSGTVGTVDVVVTNPDTQSSTLTNGFTYVVLQLTSLSRDVGSTNGGTTLDLSGAGFLNGATVTVGGAAATGVTFNSSNSITVTTPVGTAGLKDVVVTNPDLSTATLTNGFEYLPAPTTTYISHDFEDGNVAPFNSSVTGSPGGGVSAGNWGAGFAVSGTQSVRAQKPGGALGAARLVHNYTGRPPENPGGLYQRWYIRMDATTLNTIRPGQVKLLLNRGIFSGNPPSWFHMGVGAEFPDVLPNNDEIGVLRDYDTGAFPSFQTKTGFVIQPDTWVEIQTFYERTGGTSRARLWINGKNYIDVTDGKLGALPGQNGLSGTCTGNCLTQGMQWAFAIDFTQNTTSGPMMTMYVDDATAANGYIDP